MNTSVLRHLVGILLILPELKRGGDLAEHIAQRAVSNLGCEMTPLSRGIVQRMAESRGRCGAKRPRPTAPEIPEVRPWPKTTKSLTYSTIASPAKSSRAV